MSVITRIFDRSEIFLIIFFSFHVKLFLNSWKRNLLLNMYGLCDSLVAGLRISVTNVSNYYGCSQFDLQMYEARNCYWKHENWHGENKDDYKVIFVFS